MQPQHILEKMSDAGSLCEQLDEYVVRCTKKYGDNQPYAVYYFDVHGDVPRTDDALLGFQEKYLSEKFFTGPRHLRWNHYVVFLIDDKNWPTISKSEVRQRIESDTTYSRKFVIAARDFDEFVASQRELVSEPKGPDDPTLAWRQALRASGLEGVVYAKHRGPTVSAWIDGTWKPGRVAEDVPAQKALPEDGKRIVRIAWERFRAWPSQKDFEFRSVNLISGVNGVGKTSLLEAIESFFCGETRRNGVAPAARRDVKGILEGDTKFTTLSQLPADRKHRDLRWFGAYFRNKNELVENFNRYLFFNTDAAFLLENAEKGRFVSEAIARIALGPAAMDLWGRLEEFYKEFQSQQAQLDRRGNRIAIEVEAAKVEVRRLKEIALTSEKKLDALRKSMERASWKKAPKALDDFEDLFLSQVLGVFEQSEIFASLESPFTSISSIKKEEKNLARRIEQGRAHNKSLARVQRTIEKTVTGIEDTEKQVVLLHRLRAYADSGWLETVRLTSATESQIEIASSTLGRIEVSAAIFTEDEKSRTVRQLAAAVEQDVRKTTAAVTIQKSSLQEQQRRLSALQHILAEAAALGRRLIDLDPNAVECPLCGQEFKPPTLRSRIVGRGDRIGVDAEATSAALKSVADLESAVQQQLQRRLALESYADLERDLRQQKRIGGSISLGELQALEAKIRGEFASVQKLRESLRSQRSKLISDGFSDREFNELIGELWSARMPEKNEEVIRRIDDQVRRAREKLAEQRETLKGERGSEKAIQNRLEEILEKPIRGVDIDQAIQELVDLQETFRAVLEVASDISTHVQIDESDNLRDKYRSISLVHDIANEISETVSAERARVATVTQVEDKYRQLVNEEKAIREKCKRASNATAAFERLFKTLSLDRVAARFVDANRVRISSILSAIHAPREFSGLAPLEEDGEQVALRLIRRDGGRNAELSEISAGQRAAVALSVFLALNEKVKSAPPIILMDDPISHVDDLNMLAFLDVMREIAATGKRQIFFATANKKVTGIFEQKFKAFGDDFKYIPLHRSR